MEDCAPFVFLGSWVLVAPYLCSRFHIFNRPILEEYVSQVEGGPHLFQSCLRALSNGMPPTAKEMRLFKKVQLLLAPKVYKASLMDIHHDTSFRSILKDNSISSTSRAHICFCLSKGARLWLITRPSIYSFCIAHSTFTLALHFHLNLIQPLASKFFTYECGHRLDASGTHLFHCPFGG